MCFVATILPAAKVFEEVNRKCPYRNTTVQHSTPTMSATMNSVTDRRTDGRQYRANSRSYCVRQYDPLKSATVFTARCYADRGYATVCRPSVRLSVTFMYRDHIGWHTSKIITRPNSLRLLLGLTSTWAIWCNENAPKLGLNRGKVIKRKNLQYLWNGARLLHSNTQSIVGFSEIPKMRDLEWPVNIIQGVLCWLWPRCARVDQVAVFSVYKRSVIDLL